MLKFDKNGHFRILMVSDFHLIKNTNLETDYTYKLINGLDELIKYTEPDFIMLGGDQCSTESTFDGVKSQFESVIEPITKRHLPWAAVFGNHDNEMMFPVNEAEKVYQSIEGNLNITSPDYISGTGNFTLPVYSDNGEEILYNIFALDSHREIDDFKKQFNLDESTRFILPEHFNAGQTGAAADFEQVMWYYNTSKELEKINGKKIPAVMFMHIPLPEYLHILRNPEECNAIGNQRETPGCCELNFGLFSACLQRGDVKGIFFGHEHLCDIQGEYCGIVMGQDAALGYNMSCHDDLRGGRVIDLFKDGSLETHTVKLMDIMGLDAMRRKDYFEGGCKYFIRKLP